MTEPKIKKDTAWYCANVEGYREKVREWNRKSKAKKLAEDPEAVRAYHSNYIRERYKSDEVYKYTQQALALERYYRLKIENMRTKST